MGSNVEDNDKIAVIDYLSPNGFQAKTDNELNNMSEQELREHRKDLGDWHNTYHQILLQKISTIFMEDTPYSNEIPF